MNLNEITKKVDELAQKSPGDMESIVKFVFDDGCVRVDDTVNPPEVNNKNEDAHCTITLSNETFTKLLNKSSRLEFLSIQSLSIQGGTALETLPCLVLSIDELPMNTSSNISNLSNKYIIPN